MDVAEIEQLELRVHQLLSTLERLRFENSGLKRKLMDSEKELAQLKNQHHRASERIKRVIHQLKDQSA